MATDQDDRDPQLEQPLPCILEALQWIGADILDRIDDREERERFLLLLKLGWNFELALRWDTDTAMRALREFIKDAPHPEDIQRSVLMAAVLKRERYAGDPRTITDVRLLDGPGGEEIAIDWEIADDLGAIVWN